MQIMLKIFAREAPVTHEGREITLPYPKDAKGSSGLGKPLMSIMHPNPNLPIWLGAGAEATTRLAAELGRGLLPLRFAPGSLAEIGPWLVEGFDRAQWPGRGKGWDDFEIQASVGVTITDDVEGALAARKPTVALYVGGMGLRGQNYHADAMTKAGFGDAATKIQELFLSGRKAEAAAAVPDAYVERGMLVGSPERIRERYQAWASSGVTGLTVSTDQPEAMELVAELAAATPALGPAAAWAAVTAGSSA